MAKVRYVVRSTAGHRGQYIKVRERNTTGTTRKYAWANSKERAAQFDYEQARTIARRYNGQVVTA